MFKLQYNILNTKMAVKMAATDSKLVVLTQHAKLES